MALSVVSMLAVTPIEAPPTRQTVVADGVRLTASTETTTGEACSGYNTDGCDIWAEQSYAAVELSVGSISNIPANIANAILSVPRAYVNALNDLAYSMEVTGSWWVYTPTNVLGYDPADPPKITALINLLIPFEALSEPIGEAVSWWAKANLPMNEGCTATAAPTCENVTALLSGMFQVSFRDLIDGYTFPELNDPVSDAEGVAGEEIDGEEGDEVPWSGATVELDPSDSVNSVINYLTADPAENTPEPVTFHEIADTLTRLGSALWDAFYPFVPGSFLWKGYPYTLVTPFIKPFVKILCPPCDPDHPEDPTPYDGELPPSSTDEDSDGDTADRATSGAADQAAGIDDLEDTTSTAAAACGASTQQLSSTEGSDNVIDAQAAREVPTAADDDAAATTTNTTATAAAVAGGDGDGDGAGVRQDTHGAAAAEDDHSADTEPSKEASADSEATTEPADAETREGRATSEADNGTSSATTTSGSPADSATPRSEGRSVGLSSGSDR